MHFILNRLAIGDYDDVMDLQTLQRYDITAVLDVTKEAIYSLPPQILRLKIPMKDHEPMEPDKIRLAVNWLRQAIRERRVLVHCMAGISRSPAIAMCYLYECGFSFDEALELIRSKREQVQPHPALLESIQDYYQVPL